MRDFSLVVPCHNEEEILEETAEDLLDLDAEIILVEDGCSDSTPEIASELADKHENIVHLGFDEQLGKGLAIEKGFERASNEKLVFTDADLSVPKNFIEESAERLEEADLVIGERRKSDRRTVRRLFSSLYNMMVRRAYGTDYSDHQCGLKSVRKGCIEEIGSLDSDHWFWDTELIVRAENQGMNIKTLEVDYSPGDDSQVNLVSDSKYLAGKAAGFALKNPRFRSRTLQLIRFGAVGLLGLAAENAILWSLQDSAPLLAAKAVGAEASIVLMFLANNYWTYSRESFTLKQLFRSHQVRILGVLIATAILLLLTSTGMNVILANTISVIAGFIFNYVLETVYTWEDL